MKILEQALNKINPIHKKQKDFLITFITALLGSVGKKTFRNVARFAQITEHTIARQMKKAFDFASLNLEMIKIIKTDFTVLVAAQDTSFASKSGRKTNGLDWFWNACAGKAEKGLELDVIAIIKVEPGKNKAFTLSAQQTPANPIPKSERKKKNLEEPNRIDFALNHVEKILLKLLALKINYMVADAFYAKIKYVDGIQKHGLHVISKLRKDAQLKRPFAGVQKKRGRRRKSENSRINSQDFQNSIVIKIDGQQIELRSCIAYSSSLKKLIKIVWIKKIIGTKEGKVFLFSTDTTQDALQIYEFYVARFQIEFIFRDAKNFTGLTDCQSRDAKRMDYHYNASLLALNVVKFQDIEMQKIAQVDHAFSMNNWIRKYHVTIVINRVFSMLNFDLTLIKSHPCFEKVLALGNIMH